MNQRHSYFQKRAIRLAICMAIGAAMSGCASEETMKVPQLEEGRISFRFESSNITRAANSYCNNRKPDRFKVWAFKNNLDYFGKGDPGYKGDLVNKCVTDGVENWIPTQNRYWPKDATGKYEELTFYAYVDDLDLDEASTSVNGTFWYDPTASTVEPEFKGYTIEGDVAKQRDLMYAVQKTKYEKNNHGYVSLSFRHALSQICFKARNDNHNLKDVAIKSISVCGLAGKGDYKLPTNPIANTTMNGTHPSNPNAGESKGVWTPTTETEFLNKAYKITNLGVTLGTPTLKAGTTDEYDNGDTKDISIVKNQNHDYENQNAFYDDFSRVMTLMPQQVNGATKSSLKAATPDGAYFELIVDITTYLDRENDITKMEGNVKIQIPVDIDWEEGKRYTYTLVWDDTEAIHFDMELADYIDNDNNVINGNFVDKHERVLMRDAYTDSNGVYYDKLYVAACNLGAERPEDAGLYFWWGDTEGHYWKKGPDGKDALYKSDGKTPDPSFSFSNSGPANSTNTSDLNALVSQGWIKSVSNPVLTEDHDAATQILGPDWHTPTESEIRWLVDKNNCEWKLSDGNLTTDNGVIVFDTKGGVNQINKIDGVTGYFVKSKRTYGIIFFPKRGYISSKSLSNATIFYAYSSSVNTANPIYSFWFYNTGIDNNYNRYNGMPIRPVSNTD